MLEIYAKEFVAIGKFLTKQGISKKNYILVDREDLKSLLNKNRYETADNKLKLWRALHWIATEDGRRVTKRVRNPETGKYEPKIAIDLKVLETLEEVLRSKKRVE